MDGLAGEMDYSHWGDGMPQPIDVHLWPVFATIQEELEGLSKLVDDQLKKIELENHRLAKRIEEVERKQNKYGVQMI